MVVLQDTLVCRCLQVMESDLLDVMDRCPVSNLQDVANQTGAGSGCTACHRLLRKYLAARAQGQSAESAAADFTAARFAEAQFGAAACSGAECSAHCGGMLR